MRSAGWLIVLVLLSPVAEASPDHGSGSVEGEFAIHFTDDGPWLATQAPTGHVLPAAPEASACDAPLRWQAPFTQRIGTPAAGLARPAEMDAAASAKLTWFIESVRPGSDEPLALPPGEVRLQGTLRAGDQTLGDGAILAEGAIVATPEAVDVPDRFVYRMDLRMPWSGDGVVPEEGFHLDLRLDRPTEVCDMAPVGIRAFSAPAAQPVMAFKLYEPVRIDLLEPVIDGDAVRIVLHASSPWGRFDLADPPAPTLTGPDGEADLGTATILGDETLQAEWLWQQGTARNGTYRIDASIDNAAGTATATATAFFQMGTTQDEAPPPPEPKGKQSSVPALPFVVAALVVALLRRR